MGDKITVTELFGAADLRACGPVPWNERVTEPSPGIYVIATVSHPNDAGDLALDVGYLDAQIAKRWMGQPVIYIGRTKRSLSRRLAEFYRHKQGARRPHQGGQDVLLLKCALWVYLCATQHPAEAEDEMIDYLKKKVGRLPFANRARSARGNAGNRIAALL
jgi:hypothetical protein